MRWTSWMVLICVASAICGCDYSEPSLPRQRQVVGGLGP